MEVTSVDRFFKEISPNGKKIVLDRSGSEQSSEGFLKDTGTWQYV